MGAYTSPTASSQGTPGAASQLSPGQQQQQTPQSFSPAPANPVATNALVNAKEEPANELEAALGRLVNVDQIDVPASAMRLTMMQEEEKKKKRPSGKSQPLPPVAHNIVGANATLSQIKQVYPVSTVDYCFFSACGLNNSQFFSIFFLEWVAESRP